MYKIIGFIPQTAQGLFSYKNEYFAINPPFKEFSMMKILEHEINSSVPYVQENAYYNELEHVFQHFQRMHLMEMLNNKNIITILSDKLEDIKQDSKSNEVKEKDSSSRKSQRLKLFREVRALKQARRSKRRFIAEALYASKKVKPQEKLRSQKGESS